MKAIDRTVRHAVRHERGDGHPEMWPLKL